MHRHRSSSYSIFLIGFDNQAGVLLQWLYSYATYRRGARIITGLDPAGRADGPAA